MPVTLSKLKNYALLVAFGIILCLAAFSVSQARKLTEAKSEAERLANNQSSLLMELHEEVNKAGKLQATVDALALRRDELETLVPKYEKQLADMRIRLKDAQHVAAVATETAAKVQARRDTVWQYVERPDPGTPTRARYTYEDAWISAVVVVEDSSLATLQVTARDSLTLVGHRERRKCLFKKPKITHYTTVSASPYTTVTGVTYVEIVENK